MGNGKRDFRNINQRGWWDAVAFGYVYSAARDCRNFELKPPRYPRSGLPLLPVRGFLNVFTTGPATLAQNFFRQFAWFVFKRGGHGVIPAVQEAIQAHNPQDLHNLVF